MFKMPTDCQSTGYQLKMDEIIQQSTPYSALHCEIFFYCHLVVMRDYVHARKLKMSIIARL